MAERFDTSSIGREEFFSEAQELVDAFGSDLLSLDNIAKRGSSDPELINDTFRTVHTLKGVAGLFGASVLAGLAHELEELLDDLRLGRTPLSRALLDVLFHASEVAGRLLAAERGEAIHPTEEVRRVLAEIVEHSQAREASDPSVLEYDLDPGLLGVLTEYEEHRLRENMTEGVSLFRLRVDFPLATIDTALEDLKARARPFGEIITYLPTGGASAIDRIELEILMASRSSKEILVESLGSGEVQVEAVARRRRPSFAPAVRPTGAPPPLVSIAPLVPMSDRNAHAGRAQMGAPSMAPQELSLRSVSQTVRVDIRKLDRLMNVVGELAIVQSSLGRLSDRMGRDPGARAIHQELERLQRSFQRNLSEVQDGILEVRMVPLGQAFEKLARAVRQLSREQGKDVELVVTGAETEIDKLIVEELADPLMHMIRNAIDHGVESKEQRALVGKPAAGTLALNAFPKGRHVVIEVEDDGSGIDSKRILSRAVDLGFVDAADAAHLTPREILSLIFLPGFTTKSSATDISGRGVGMDVVKTNIARLGGIVDVSSEIGIGTRFTVTLPVTLAILGALLVEVSGRTMAVPLTNVEQAALFSRDDFREVHGREVLMQRGRTLPVIRLAKHFGFDDPRDPKEREFILVFTAGTQVAAAVVDRIVGQQDIVIKGLGETLRNIRGFAGATELDDHHVALVLDVATILEEALSRETERGITR